jgi:Leucine-rich repeat (LRR) protein
LSVFVKDKEYKVIDSTLYLDEIDFKNFSNIKGIDELKDLRRLSLFGNFLENLDGIQRLKELEFLNLKFNHIDDLTSISKLTNLKELYLDGLFRLINIFL